MEETTPTEEATPVEETSPVKEPLRIGRFDVPDARLPEGTRSCTDLDERMLAIKRECAGFADLSDQKLVRLLLAGSLEVEVAVRRAQDTATWRRENSMDKMRQTIAAQLTKDAAVASKPVQLPQHEEVCKMCVMNICALTTATGFPVSIWHAISADSTEAAALEEETLQTWSRYAFEYLDLWITEQSERTGELGAHTLVIDMQDTGLVQLSILGYMIDKLRLAFDASAYYMESVERVYVINASYIFSAAWAIVSAFVTPRTAGKVIVSGEVPPELLASLSPASAQRLLELLEKPDPSVPVQSPPWISNGIADAPAKDVAAPKDVGLEANSEEAAVHNTKPEKSVINGVAPKDVLADSSNKHTA